MSSFVDDILHNHGLEIPPTTSNFYEVAVTYYGSFIDKLLSKPIGTRNRSNLPGITLTKKAMLSPVTVYTVPRKLVKVIAKDSNTQSVEAATLLFQGPDKEIITPEIILPAVFASGKGDRSDALAHELTHCLQCYGLTELPANYTRSWDITAELELPEHLVPYGSKLINRHRVNQDKSIGKHTDKHTDKHTGIQVVNRLSKVLKYVLSDAEIDPHLAAIKRWAYKNHSELLLSLDRLDYYVELLLDSLDNKEIPPDVGTMVFAWAVLKYNYEAGKVPDTALDSLKARLRWLV